MVSSSLAGQAQDEVAVDHQAELVAIFGELAGAFNGCAFLDVLQNLLVAGFVAHDEQAASGFFHGLESFVIGGHARGARPGKPQRLQLGAEFDGARLLDVEGVIVEEKFFDFGPVLFGLRHFGGDIVGGAFAPGMSTQGLRPQAEGALRRAAARGVQRDIRIQQERHVVAGDVEIALVNVGNVGQRVEILNLRGVGIVHDLVHLSETRRREFPPAACPWRNRSRRSQILCGTTKSMAGQSRKDFSGNTLTWGPTKAILIFGLAALMARARPISPGKPGVLVNSTRNS